MKFLCDEMLADLARWLRAAGYDAAMGRAGDVDRSLVQRAQAEGCILLTRDRAILQIKDAEKTTVVLHGDDLDAWAQELHQLCHVDWLHRPMSRCLVCNVELIDADAATVAHMPEDSRARPGPFKSCPHCKRGYWPGSHAKRMIARLESFSRSSGQSSAKRP